MTTIVPGATSYLNAAKLANKQGYVSSTSYLMSSMSFDVLEIGRSTNSSGLGLSANARALNRQYLSSTKTDMNKFFSLTTYQFGSMQTLSQTILALRSKMPASQLSEEVRASMVDIEA